MTLPTPPSRDQRAQDQLPYRCPRCFVRYPLGTYTCMGGWPAAVLGARSAPHPPVRVALIPTPRTP